jgi:hypothetical protein
MGWLTVAAYMISMVIAFKVFLTSQQLFSADVVKTQQIFWLFVTLILLILGINKQLDLQSLFTSIGKYYAHRDGWYQHRRSIQLTVIVGLIVSMLMVMTLFIYYLRNIFRRNWLAIVGLIFLVIFVAIRATSFHHIDILINTYILGFKINWVLELSGIIVIALAAFLTLYKRRY